REPEYCERGMEETDVDSAGATVRRSIVPDVRRENGERRHAAKAIHADESASSRSAASFGPHSCSPNLSLAHFWLSDKRLGELQIQAGPFTACAVRRVALSRAQSWRTDTHV